MIVICIPVAQVAHSQFEVQVTVIPDRLNVRQGASFDAVTLGAYTRGEVLRITGWDGTVWVFAIPGPGGTDNLTGWVHWDYVDFPAGFDVGTLPIINATGSVGTDSGASGAGGDVASSDAGEVAVPIGTAPGIPSGVIPRVGGRAREIFLAGQAHGNRANAFAKVGDSITDMPMFLYPIAGGQYNLGEYTTLQSVIGQFSGSFGRVSAAAHGGWTTYDLLDPAKNFQGFCNAGESPLMCEYRVHKPAVALIMIGTNDAEFGVTAGAYRANLETIIQMSIDMGVIPVLSTIPDNVRDM